MGKEGQKGARLERRRLWEAVSEAEPGGEISRRGEIDIPSVMSLRTFQLLGILCIGVGEEFQNTGEIFQMRRMVRGKGFCGLIRG